MPKRLDTKQDVATTMWIHEQMWELEQYRLAIRRQTAPIRADMEKGRAEWREWERRHGLSGDSLA